MRTLLIDGDIFAYRAASAAETVVNFGDPDEAFATADADEAKENLDNVLAGFRNKLMADEIVVALTPTNDPTNFRRGILPTYKQARGEVRRPIVLEDLKQHLLTEYAAKTKPSLEADDILGIWATNPKLVRGEKIIVTIDKDLRTVPGLHWNPLKDDEGVVEVSRAEADRNHLYQTLMGDIVDGFSGCPGIGSTKAARHLDGKIAVRSYQHVFTRGPRKGTSETRWEEFPAPSAWDVVVSLYDKAGLTPVHALQQAQVARICRHSDFNYKTQRPIPWQPST